MIGFELSPEEKRRRRRENERARALCQRGIARYLASHGESVESIAAHLDITPVEVERLVRS